MKYKSKPRPYHTIHVRYNPSQVQRNKTNQNKARQTHAVQAKTISYNARTRQAKVIQDKTIQYTDKTTQGKQREEHTIQDKTR